MKTPMSCRVKWTWAFALSLLFSLAAGPLIAGSDVIFTGGGFIKEGKSTAAKRISFSVSLFADSEGTSEGHLNFDFHNLDDSYGLDQSRFVTSGFDWVFIETRYMDTTPYTFVRIEAHGQLDGQDGWSVLVRFSDFGMPVNNTALPLEHADALRIRLFNPSGIAVYDTALDYPREQSWRTLLDGGNVSIDMKLFQD